MGGGGRDAFVQVDEIISRIRDSVHPEANIIFGSTFDQTMRDRIRVSVIITGLSKPKPGGGPTLASVSAGAPRPPSPPPPPAYEVRTGTLAITATKQARAAYVRRELMGALGLPSPPFFLKHHTGAGAPPCAASVARHVL